MALRLIAVTAAVAAVGALLTTVVLAGQQRSEAWTGRDLGTLGGRHSSAWAINDRGQIVGVSATASRGRRFVLWQEDKPAVDLGPAPEGSGQPQIQLNERGEALLAGSLWSQGRLTRLPFNAFALNDRGQIVGTRGGERSHAVLWEKGRITDLGVLPGGFTWSAAESINNAGVVVGTSSDPHARMQAFHWSNGKLSPLPILRRFADCRGLAVNSRGQTLGYCSADKPFRVHSVLWQGTGPPRDLGTLDDKHWVYPLQLNERGQVVGMTRVNGKTTAFLWDGRRLISLAPMTVGLAAGLNDRGQVVAAANGDAAIWDNGVITRLGPTGPRSLSAAYAINEPGQVVGFSMTDEPGPTYATPRHAYLWTTRG